MKYPKHLKTESGSDRLVNLQKKECFLLIWKQVSSTKWEAVGKYGKYTIVRAGGKFWSFYATETTWQTLRPADTLPEAKVKCEDNLTARTLYEKD